MEISFKNQRILVTGAGRGIGREVALSLARCGAQVVALSRTQHHLDTLVAEAKAGGFSITPLCVDVADWARTRQLLAGQPPFDGLVNNAGVACLNHFASATKDDVDKSFEVNLKAVINISQVVSDGMIKSGKGGSIVNVSSQTAMVAIPNHAVYSATKGGLDQLSRAMALELGPHNIRTNCVNPTVVWTEMTKKGWPDPDKLAAMISKIPLGKLAETTDVANAVLFLLSDKAAMINGVSLPVDGGFTAT
ncbi:D-erythrulose reductase-like [Schistocerca nitens]|uniref:D-erythrulose reductase-like n=1 Tax=Schistocerca nitens TaxID=7011 RepID=UPI002118900B|nr:D-erythrulose reductase-like [Schistocerca nitens]